MFQDIFWFSSYVWGYTDPLECLFIKVAFLYDFVSDKPTEKVDTSDTVLAIHGL